MSENPINLGSVLTDQGKSMMTNHAAYGTQFRLDQFAVGSGTEILDALSKKLTKEEYRGQITHSYTHADNPNWLVIEGYIPQSVGGWYIREIGIYAGDDLFAVANVAESYKPKIVDGEAVEGTAKDVNFRFIIQVSDAESVVIKIDPTIAMASQSWVNNNSLPAEHMKDFDNPHQVTAEQIGAVTKAELEETGSPIKYKSAFHSKSGNVKLLDVPMNVDVDIPGLTLQIDMDGTYLVVASIRLWAPSVSSVNQWHWWKGNVFVNNVFEGSAFGIHLYGISTNKDTTTTYNKILKLKKGDKIKVGFHTRGVSGGSLEFVQLSDAYAQNGIFALRLGD